MSQISAEVKALAERLGETEMVALNQLRRAWELCGPAQLKTVLQATLECEAQGGLLTKDQSRRRTLGGVFFHLLRASVSKAQWRTINPAYVRVKDAREQAKAKARALPPLDWAARAPVVQATQPGPAEATVTIVGRPFDALTRSEGFVVLKLEEAARLPSGAVARGVPVCAMLPKIYLVCASEAQWRETEPVLRQNPLEALVAEGAFCLNSKGVPILLAQRLGAQHKVGQGAQTKTKLRPAATHAQIVLTGRPLKVAEQGATAVMTLTVAKAPTGLPANLPRWPGAQTYAVYLAAYQWATVAPLLAVAPDAQVMVRGYVRVEDGLNVLANQVKVLGEGQKP